MFKSSSARGDLNGFLDAGSTIVGELHFEDTFRIDGRLEGKVVSRGDLIVGEGGVVEGEVVVGRVYVSGEVRGAVRARRRLEVNPEGRVKADVETSTLVIEAGALFEGRCVMPAAAGAEEAGEEEGAVVQRMRLPRDG